MKSFPQLISFVCIILGLSAKGIIAQTQYSNPETYNIINGLPNNEVRCLLKDSKGYIWVGTSYGLAKYDGNKFSVFKHLPNSNSISGDVITVIFEDDKENILIGANGLSILERKTGKWKNYLHDPNNKLSISNPGVSSIAQENDSIYWIITYNGVNKFNINTGRFTNLKFNVNSRILSSKILDFVPNRSISFFISFTAYQYDLINNTYKALTISNFEFNNDIVFNRNIVGVKRLGLDKYKLVRYDISTKKEYSLLEVNDGNCLLFHDNKTLYLVYKNKICSFNETFKLTNTIFFQPQKLKSKIEYYCGLKEENGTIWIGTSTGLFKILPNSPFHILDGNNRLPNEYIRSLAIDSQNNLWIGVRQGVTYQIPKADSLTINKRGNVNNIPFPTINGEVYATNQILELKNKDFLFVTNKAIYYYSALLQKFTVQFYIPKNGQYFSALEIPGGILIGSLEKPTLFKIIIDSNRIKRDTSLKIQNMPDVVYSLYKDNENEMWLGGEGLYKLHFNGSSNSINVETIIPSINETNYTNNSVWNILEIDNARLIVCTTTNGFYIYNKHLNKIEHFNKNNGLSTDFTCAIQKDHNNNLWMSTKEGISFIDSKNYKIKNYTVKNGPFNCDFNFKSSAKTHNNFLLFGSKQGIVYFNPDSIKSNSIKYPLLINEFRVFDNVVRRELKDKDTIFLNHDENFFSFEFSLLDFRNPKEIQYKYQLLKYNNTERTVNNGANSANYTDVPPGKYIFQLTSSNSTDIDCEQKIELLLIIRPAFYQTLLFKILSVLIALTIIVLIILVLIRRQMLRSRLYKMELDLLRAQINPHFIFNTLTSIQQSILMNSKDIASDHLSKFSRLMRMCLDYSRLEYIPLEKAIHFYKTYVSVESVNLDEEISFQVIIDKTIDSQKTLISPMLIQPFIENAIIHGLAPKQKDMHLELTINKMGGLLICTIKDNGIGRAKASEIAQKKATGHQSMGIELTKKRILLQFQKNLLIKDSIDITDNYDENGNPTGTTVMLKILYRL